MYYIIETTQIGHVDGDTIDIVKVPPRTNLSGETRTWGWLGQSGDCNQSAWGQYETLGEAKAAIAEMIGEVREEDPNGQPFESAMFEDLGQGYEDDAFPVSLYTCKPGKYHPLNEEATLGWIFEVLTRIKAEFTDRQLIDLISELENDAYDDGFELDQDVLEQALFDRRDELKKNGEQ